MVTSVAGGGIDRPSPGSADGIGGGFLGVAKGEIVKFFKRTSHIARLNLGVCSYFEMRGKKSE